MQDDLSPVFAQSQRIARGFDGEAPTYDRAFSDNPAARRMRRDTHRVYLRHLRPGHLVLDLNCGTGEDLAFFNQAGISAHGLDISAGMLARARQRAPGARLFHKDFNRLDELGDTYDAICSNFGGFNTQDRFHHVAADCRQRLKPGGILFVNIMTRWPLFEIGEGILGGGHFFRRIRTGGRARLRVGGAMVCTYFFDPHAFYRRFFKKEFSLLSVTGLGILLPPPYLQWQRRGLIRTLSLLERPLQGVWPFNKLGDHALLAMRARG